MSKVLVVEDNKESLYMLETLLKGHGFEVLTAANGAEALKNARRDMPDMIITDILMPVMDGFSLCREWKKDERLRKIPFVFYTATYVDPKEEELALSLGADGFILKPTDPDEFMRILLEIIEKCEGGEPAAVREPVDEEMDFKLYSQRLVKKLEKKLLELRREAAERKLTEKALRGSEGRFRWLVHASPLPIVALGAKGEVTIWNAAAERVFGWTEQEALGRRPPYVPEDRLGESRSLFERVLQGESFSGLELYRQKKDGSLIPVSFSAAPLRDASGAVASAMAILEDVSERKRVSDELRAAKEYWNNIFESISDLTLILSPDHRLLDINHAGEVALGQPKEEILGRPCYELFHCTDRPPEDCPHEKLLRSEHPETVQMEMEVFKGTYLVSVSPVLDREGRITKTIHIAKDVTERNRAEKALRQYAAELSNLHRLSRETSASLSLDHVASAALDESLAATESDFAILYLREGDRLLLKGVRPEGPQFDSAGSEERRVGDCLCGLAASEGRAVYSEDIHSDARCTLEECKLAGIRSLAALPLSGGNGVLGTLALASLAKRDYGGRATFLETLAGHVAVAIENALLHEQVQQHADELEERVADRTEELRKKAEELESFAHTVSHDLRAPLRAVQGFSHALIEDLGERLEAEPRRDLLAIGRAAESMDRLIEDLLAYSRLGQQAFSKTDVPLERVVRHAEAGLQAEIRRSGAVIRVAGRLPVVRGHEQMLVQIVGNLLGNAVKFVPRAGRPDVEISAARSGQRVRVSVRDNGIGIAPEFGEKIFTIFERLHSREEYPGTGIGLAIAKKAVEIHGGSIGVESEPGKGCTFWFEIPED